MHFAVWLSGTWKYCKIWTVREAFTKMPAINQRCRFPTLNSSTSRGENCIKRVNVFQVDFCLPCTSCVWFCVKNCLFRSMFVNVRTTMHTYIHLWLSVCEQVCMCGSLCTRMYKCVYIGLNLMSVSVSWWMCVGVVVCVSEQSIKYSCECMHWIYEKKYIVINQSTWLVLNYLEET